MRYNEVSFKYPLLKKLKDGEFVGICAAKKPLTAGYISGYDHFYTNALKPHSFFRHRVDGKKPETGKSQLLTYKMTPDPKSLYHRVAHSLELSGRTTRSDVSDMCADLGYRYDFSLFKNSVIVVFERYFVCHYICYNLDMQELGRYVEIEANGTYNWKDEMEAWNAIVTAELGLKELGIEAKYRIENSLFEMYQKVN